MIKQTMPQLEVVSLLEAHVRKSAVGAFAVKAQ